VGRSPKKHAISGFFVPTFIFKNGHLPTFFAHFSFQKWAEKFTFFFIQNIIESNTVVLQIPPLYNSLDSFFFAFLSVKCIRPQVNPHNSPIQSPVNRQSKIPRFILSKWCSKYCSSLFRSSIFNTSSAFFSDFGIVKCVDFIPYSCTAYHSMLRYTVMISRTYFGDSPPFPFNFP